MICGLIILGIAIFIAIIATGSEESTQLCYDVVEDADDMRSSKADKESMEKPAKNAQASSTPGETEALAQDIYDSIDI